MRSQRTLLGVCVCLVVLLLWLKYVFVVNAFTELQSVFVSASSHFAANRNNFHFTNCISTLHNILYLFTSNAFPLQANNIRTLIFVIFGMQNIRTDLFVCVRMTPIQRIIAALLFILSTFCNKCASLEAQRSCHK